MMLKPCRGLANGVFMKILDVKTMGNDANTGCSCRKGAGAWPAHLASD